MKTIRIARFAACTLLLLAAVVQSAAAQTVGTDASAVAATVQSFHAALSSGNAEAAARLLAPDAVVLEGGEKETREEYVGHHLLEDIKFAKAVPSTRGQAEVTVAGDVAWASSTSVTRGTYQSKALDLVNAELMVLTRTKSGWQIRAIHWSSRKGKQFPVNGAAATMSLLGTTWEFEDDGVPTVVTIDQAGAYIEERADGTYVVHGTYAQRDGKDCFTPAMGTKGTSCWTAVPRTDIGQTASATHDKGGSAEFTRVAYRQLKPPAD